MKPTGFALTTLAAVGLLNVAAFGQSSSQSQDSSQSPSQSGGAAAASSGHDQQASSQQQQRAGQSARSGSQSQAPEGFVLVEERLVVVTANEPQNHFVRAHDQLMHGNAKAAAAEIRIGADYLEMQASRADGQSKQDLTQAADHLRDEAKQIAQGQNASARQSSSSSSSNSSSNASQAQGQQNQTAAAAQQPSQEQQQRLAKSFARANYALAKFYQSQAERDIQKNKAVVAGDEVQASAASLGAALTWAGQRVPADLERAVAAAQALGSQLASGETLTPSHQAPGEAQPAAARSSGREATGQSQAQNGRIPPEATKAIKDLGDVIDKVGDKFQLSGQSSGQSSGQQNQK